MRSRLALGIAAALIAAPLVSSESIAADLDYQYSAVALDDGSRVQVGAPKKVSFVGPTEAFTVPVTYEWDISTGGCFDADIGFYPEGSSQNWLFFDSVIFDKCASYDQRTGSSTLPATLYPWVQGLASSKFFTIGGTIASASSSNKQIFTPLKVSIERVPTRIQGLSVKEGRVKGTVVADTESLGTVGGDGKIRMLVRIPKSKKWKQVFSRDTGSSGAFNAQLRSKAPRGSDVKLVFSNCFWCADLTTIVRMR